MPQPPCKRVCRENQPPTNPPSNSVSRENTNAFGRNNSNNLLTDAKNGVSNSNNNQTIDLSNDDDADDELDMLLSQPGECAKLDALCEQLFAQEKGPVVREIAHIAPVTNMKEFAAPFVAPPPLRKANATSTAEQLAQSDRQNRELERLKAEYHKQQEVLRKKEGENKILREKKQKLEKDIQMAQSQALIAQTTYEQAQKQKDKELRSEVERLKTEISFKNQEVFEAKHNLLLKDTELKTTKCQLQTLQEMSQHVDGSYLEPCSQPTESFSHHRPWSRVNPPLRDQRDASFVFAEPLPPSAIGASSSKFPTKESFYNDGPSCFSSQRPLGTTANASRTQRFAPPAQTAPPSAITGSVDSFSVKPLAAAVNHQEVQVDLISVATPVDDKASSSAAVAIADASSAVDPIKLDKPKPQYAKVNLAPYLKNYSVADKLAMRMNQVTLSDVVSTRRNHKPAKPKPDASKDLTNLTFTALLTSKNKAWAEAVRKQTESLQAPQPERAETPVAAAVSTPKSNNVARISPFNPLASSTRCVKKPPAKLANRSRLSTLTLPSFVSTSNVNNSSVFGRRLNATRPSSRHSSSILSLSAVPCSESSFAAGNNMDAMMSSVNRAFAVIERYVLLNKAYVHCITMERKLAASFDRRPSFMIAGAIDKSKRKTPTTGPGSTGVAAPTVSVPTKTVVSVALGKKASESTAASKESPNKSTTTAEGKKPDESATEVKKTTETPTKIPFSNLSRKQLKREIATTLPRVFVELKTLSCLLTNVPEAMQYLFGRNDASLSASSRKTTTTAGTSAEATPPTKQLEGDKNIQASRSSSKSRLSASFVLACEKRLDDLVALLRIANDGKLISLAKRATLICLCLETLSLTVSKFSELHVHRLILKLGGIFGSISHFIATRYAVFRAVIDFLYSISTFRCCLNAAFVGHGARSCVLFALYKRFSHKNQTRFLSDYAYGFRFLCILKRITDYGCSGRDFLIASKCCCNSKIVPALTRLLLMHLYYQAADKDRFRKKPAERITETAFDEVEVTSVDPNSVFAMILRIGSAVLESALPSQSTNTLSVTHTPGLMRKCVSLFVDGYSDADEPDVEETVELLQKALKVYEREEETFI